MDKKQVEIKKYLDLNLEDLFILLGETEYANKHRFSTAISDPEKGREIFNLIKSTLFQKICVEFQFCEKIKNPNFKIKLILVETLMEIIQHLLAPGIPPILIATIIAKIGIKKFCKC